LQRNCKLVSARDKKIAGKRAKRWLHYKVRAQKNPRGAKKARAERLVFRTISLEKGKDFW